MTKVGWKPSSDITAIWQGFTSLGDGESRRAFLATGRRRVKRLRRLLQGLGLRLDLGLVVALHRRFQVRQRRLDLADHVAADLAAVLGPKLDVSRGDLNRTSLSLQTIRLPSQAERLAWLAEQLATLQGHGIIYTLTVRDARGLSYIAQGDWCDPMNMVGYQGRGVSGWLSVATAYALQLWASICERHGRAASASGRPRSSSAFRADRLPRRRRDRRSQLDHRAALHQRRHVPFESRRNGCDIVLGTGLRNAESDHALVHFHPRQTHRHEETFTHPCEGPSVAGKVPAPTTVAWREF